MSARERIGVFGGTFDPLHVGHLVAGTTVREELNLDRVLFVVAHVPWQKADTRFVTPSHHRLAMVEAALDGLDGLDASTLEIDRGGDSYTADTLDELTAPDRELVVILGSDAAQGLPTWDRRDEVKELADIVVVDRPGTEGNPPPDGWQWRVVESPLIDLSSSNLRQRLADDLTVRFLVPDPVIDYVQRFDLYRELR